MKIYIPHSEDNKTGGGWSWISNIKKAIPEHLTSYELCDIYLIPSPSMCTKEEVDQAQADGKKIVLRVDNIVRNSRNRNTGMSRMKRFAEQANLIIYQSEFARNLLIPYLERDGVVILNSVDTSIFNPFGRMENEVAKYMYSRVNRDETKNWEMARLLFQQESWRRRGQTKLNIVGQFSPELIEYNFDFYMDEDYNYWGVIQDPSTLASIYRDSDYFIYSYWNDACSNSLIEALCCGCVVSDPHAMLRTGGAPEIVRNFEQQGSEYFALKRMGNDYIKAMEIV
jgi:glycosyltransferase involved in cell wall biosynthesis